MAEQVPEAPPEPISTVPNQPNLGSGTYVVQVPKDQIIYRFPSHEYASNAQSHRNSEQNKGKARCCSCFSCCVSIIAIFIVVIAITIGVAFVFLKPKNPKFQVQRVVVKNSSLPEYDIWLRVHNPNGKSSILYKQGGVIALSFRHKKIATGKFPSFHQDQQNSTDIGIALKGSNIRLPNDIQNSMKSAKTKVNVSLSLSMDVPVRMKTSSFTTGEAKLVITCDFTVDTLAKGTRILSQECQTNR